MNAVASFYRTAVGKKFVMALTGLLFFGWLMAHMAGNLKIFLGQEHFNEYAHWLREMGSPAVPHGTVLWISRIVLLAALALHFTAALQLTRMNWSARPERYQLLESQQAGLAQRTMIFSGLLLLLYVIYHLMHLTLGTAHHDFHAADPYRNVVTGFQLWPVALVYMAANVLLGVHLYHGLWSLFQSLGWNHKSYNPLRRIFAVTFSVILAGGFLSVPLAVLTGVVS